MIRLNLSVGSERNVSSMSESISLDNVFVCVNSLMNTCIVYEWQEEGKEWRIKQEGKEEEKEEQSLVLYIVCLYNYDDCMTVFYFIHFVVLFYFYFLLEGWVSLFAWLVSMPETH